MFVSAHSAYNYQFFVHFSERIPDNTCKASYSELARALQGVAYDMTNNDTESLIEALCNQ